MKNILVVGGAGYIGSHTCKVLRARGYNCVVFDNLSLGHERFVKWGELIEGDIRDSAKVRAAIEAHNIDAVIHFAAFAYVGESVTDPAKYYENNVVGTLGLLNGIVGTQCKNIVFSSTCAVYGEPTDERISERTPCRPVNPYGRTKLICEGMLEDFSRAYGLTYTALRYFNACGDDPDGEVGEDREIETHLIPRALMALQGYIDNFEVFGSDFPTEDGTAIRDYIHVLDLANAHILAVQRLLDGGHSDIYNLGTGKGYSVGEVLNHIRQITGRDMAAPKGPRRPGDPAKLIADALKARDVLGFLPIHSDMDTIIKTAWNWHLKAHPARAPRGSASATSN
jgi:UDP-glucose-4-epimerase GalE